MQVRSRKRKNGSTVYFMDYRLEGRRFQKILKAVKSKKEAQQVADLLWAKLVREHQLGDYAPESAADRCISLADALEADLRRTGVSPWTTRMERGFVKNIVRILGASTPLLAVSTADIDRYKRTRLGERVRKLTDAMKKRGTRLEDIPLIKPISINKELEYLRAVFNRARRQRMISRIPAEIVKLPVERTRARALTEGELLAILAKCAEHSEDMLEKTVFFANTGFRKSEAFNARWSDLDHTPGFIRVLTKKKGTSNEYYEDLVPLNQAAQAAVNSRRTRCDAKPGSEALIFGVSPEDRRACATAKNPHLPGTLDGIACNWDHGYGAKLKACAHAAQVSWWKTIRIHHLRHTFATITLDRGANVMEVARLVRHRDPMLTVRTYLHTRDEGVLRAVNSLNLGLGIEAPRSGTDARTGGHVLRDGDAGSCAST